MNKVKAISLDDMDELPNPLGSTTSQVHDDTMNKHVAFTPAYANQNAHEALEHAHDMDDGTVRRGGKFQISESFTRFSAVLGMRRQGGGLSGKVNPLLIGLLLVVGLCGGAYLYFGDELITKIMNEISPSEEGILSETAPTMSPLPASDKGEASAAPEVMDASVVGKPEVQISEEIPGNAYWKLPNPAPALSVGTLQITPQQTDSWRAGLNHPFHYQRLKSTQEMRKTKVEGTVAILYEALAQPKFWTRMEALQGIADQGVAIDTESMRTAIGDARSDLVKNYFKRFRTDYNETTAHVMRQALRVVDGRARYVILGNLLKRRSEVNEQYLYAASVNETDASVKTLVAEALAIRPVLAANKALYDRAMASEGPISIAAKKGVQDIKVEKIPANMNVEEVYFINEENSEPTQTSAPVEEVKKVDDGFNDLTHSDQAPTQGGK
ncbi:MAG: hypothetical protein V4655_13060 [Bdellovibrionota bacterium]|nr:MAG: hypothetical protein EOP10_16560 [Pseudomonadota bacterium]